jgi:hypothetical protein
MGSDPKLAALLRMRIEGFARYAEWEAAHPARLTPSDAVASIGAIYALLPPESRRVPVDASGVRRMQDALRRLRP